VVATTLGITNDEVLTALKDGQTLAELAVSNGKTAQDVIDAIVAEATTRINTAVADGKITQAQADERLADVTTFTTEFVNNGGPAFAGGTDTGSAVHGAGAAGNITFNGINYRGAEDQGNAVYEFGRRYMINNTLALMFHDAYNYASVNPAKWGTTYSVLNSTSGVVTVRGGATVHGPLPKP
jgi:hypothetical protein